MGVDIFAHFYLEEHTAAGWSPVHLVARRKEWDQAELAPGAAEIALPYEELGDVGFRVLCDLATAHFRLKKRPPSRSRGLPKDVSAPLLEGFKAAREDALAQIGDELGEEYADDLSLGEGWITAEELAKVDWDRPPSAASPPIASSSAPRSSRRSRASRRSPHPTGCASSTGSRRDSASPGDARESTGDARRSSPARRSP